MAPTLVNLKTVMTHDASAIKMSTLAIFIPKYTLKSAV